MNLQNLVNDPKSRLFATAGGIGALAGSLVGYALGGSQGGLIATSVWDAWIGVGIGIAVAIAQNRYLHAEHVLNARAYKASLRCGLGGAAGGAALILLKNVADGSAGHVCAWTLEGTIFGALLAPVLPNMERTPAAKAGAIAGALGGVTSLVLPSVVGSALGVAVADSFKGILVAGLLSNTEKALIRDQASVTVHWGPRESSTLLLGAEPICFGPGPECQVYVAPSSKETPQVIARLFVRDSRVVIESSKLGSPTPLSNGSVINIGVVKLEIHM